MWASTKLSLVSAVCEPVTSMLFMVAVNVIAVWAELNWIFAVPKDAGRAPPTESVGVVGGTSCALVRLATKSLVSLGVRFAVVRRLSTYWAFVRVAGYLLSKSGRRTKSLK